MRTSRPYVHAPLGHPDGRGRPEAPEHAAREEVDLVAVDRVEVAGTVRA